MPARLLTLFDDIAAVLDDVAVMAKVAAKKTTMFDDVVSMTKVATKKTAGVLGDDLALNAEQVAGVASERELPVVLAVARGSLLNKAILVPAALLISAFASWLITPLLMLGGGYLCFEGAEKVLHRFFHKKHAGKAEDGSEDEAAAALPADPAAQEKAKIRGAVRTDFILSAEIIVIALGSVPQDSGIAIQAAVLSLVALMVTVGVYGLVAIIVKLDDAGLALLRNNEAGSAKHGLGRMLLKGAPVLMRFLGLAGTLAMFMVGGGILVHGLPFMHAVTDALAGMPGGGLWNTVVEAFAGLAAGTLVLLAVTFISRLLPKKAGVS